MFHTCYKFRTQGYFTDECLAFNFHLSLIGEDKFFLKNESSYRNTDLWYYPVTLFTLKCRNGGEIEPYSGCCDYEEIRELENDKTMTALRVYINSVKAYVIDWVLVREFRELISDSITALFASYMI